MSKQERPLNMSDWTDYQLDDWFDEMWEKSKKGQISENQMESVAEVYLDLMSKMK